MATPSGLPQICFDTCVIIDLLQKKKVEVKFIVPIVKDAENKKMVIVVSTMAIAETLKLDGVLTPSDEAIINDFFERPHIHREAAGISVAEIARDIRRLHDVDGADALHLATAIFTKTPVFLTLDGSGRRSKKPLLPLDKKITMNGITLRVLTPEKYDGEEMAKEIPMWDKRP